MSGNQDGMGIHTNTNDGRAWEIDGLESFSMTGSQDYSFEGFKSRGGYNFADGQNRQIAISSASTSSKFLITAGISCSCAI